MVFRDPRGPNPMILEPLDSGPLGRLKTIVFMVFYWFLCVFYCFFIVFFMVFYTFLKVFSIVWAKKCDSLSVFILFLYFLRKSADSAMKINTFWLKVQTAQWKSILFVKKCIQRNENQYFSIKNADSPMKINAFWLRMQTAQWKSILFSQKCR